MMLFGWRWWRGADKAVEARGHRAEMPGDGLEGGIRNGFRDIMTEG